MLWHEHEDTGEGDPDQAAAAQQSDDWHQQVQRWISQVCLDPIQNHKFKSEHGCHLVPSAAFKSSTGFKADPQWLQYESSGLQFVPQEGQAV